VQWSGVAAIGAGLALIAGQLAFWLLVPESREVREQRDTVVFATAASWLLAHALLAPGIAGIYSQVFRRVGAFGGAGAVMSVLGTIAICFYVFFLFPELIGFSPDTIDRAQVALALQALGEAGAASLLAGLFLLSLTMILTHAFTPAGSALVAAGSLVAPFGLTDLGWLALAAVLVGTGVIWMGILLWTGRAPTIRQAGPNWPIPARPRQFKF
jgi:hypothetical protein